MLENAKQVPQFNLVSHPDMDPDKGPEDRARPGAEPDQGTEAIPETQEIDFVTLGMFIIGTS